jgi:hypothetical protein
MQFTTPPQSHARLPVNSHLSEATGALHERRRGVVLEVVATHQTERQHAWRLLTRPTQRPKPEATMQPVSTYDARSRSELCCGQHARTGQACRRTAQPGQGRAMLGNMCVFVDEGHAQYRSTCMIRLKCGQSLDMLMTKTHVQLDQWENLWIAQEGHRSRLLCTGVCCTSSEPLLSSFLLATSTPLVPCERQHVSPVRTVDTTGRPNKTAPCRMKRRRAPGRSRSLWLSQWALGHRQRVPAQARLRLLSWLLAAEIRPALLQTTARC